MKNTIKKLRFIAGMMLVIFGVLLGCGRGGPKRLPESGFQVEFGSHNVASEMTSGKTVSADITIKNVSPVTWPSKPDSSERYAVNLSYHWLDKKGETVVFDGLRTPLPRDLKSGESVDLKAAIQAPAKPGRYTLELTLVQERSAWFPEKNGAKLVLPVTVVEGGEVSADAGANATAQTQARAAIQEKKTRAFEKPKTPQEEAKGAGKTPSKETPAHDAAAKTDKLARSSDGDSGPWSVQVGSYAEKKIAASLVNKLKDKGYDAYIAVVRVKGKEWYRVRVGHLKRRAEAETLRDNLRSAEKLARSIVTSR